jgi:uncharacterized protein
VTRRRPTASRSWRHSSEALTTREDGRLRLVVVADTHSRPHPASHTLIDAQAPDAILHGGDIGELSVLDGLRELAPTIAVRGNIDIRAPTLPDSVDVAIRHPDGKTHFVLLLQHIAIHGVRLRADAARNATEHGASAVICGHSHVPFIGEDRQLLIFNPGSIGPRRFTLPITFGVVDIGAGGIDLHHVSCETGQPWLPG